MSGSAGDEELVEREAQWRASLFEVSEYYEDVLELKDAEIARLETLYAGMVADRDQLRAVVERHERVLGRIRNTPVWRIARAVGRRGA